VLKAAPEFASSCRGEHSFRRNRREFDVKLRAIIADDEPLARERIRSFLADAGDVQIVAECSHGAQALKAIQDHHPDLLFLDVQMPRLNGFEVLEALQPPQIPAAVIFTTAYDEHAIHAFEVNALDYLLKPFTEARFNKAVQRARDQLEKGPRRKLDPQVNALLNHVHASTPGGGRILVRTAERIVFVRPEEIDHVEAAGNYVVLHTGKERHILRETTAAMETRLSPAGFMRISRSIIVNLARIGEVQPLGPGQYSLLLKNGTRLDMTCSLGELHSRLSEI
jgi:two-component system LytT family response regulator